jgi:hypothetical protein
MSDYHARALERFKSKCQFDPATGCVLWAGALTSGKGSCCVYGRFWYMGKSHYAHRWAAEHIHQLKLTPGYHVGHCCERPNTLCVQHVADMFPSDNWKMINRDGSALDQSGASLAGPDPGEVPFHSEPEWLSGKQMNGNDDDCPF